MSPTPIQLSLRRVDAGLSLPMGQRLRILRELSADMQDLAAEFRAQGMPPVEADLQAVSRVEPDAQSLHSLVGVHRSLLRRTIEAAWGPNFQRVERGGLLVGTAFLLCSCLGILVWLQLLSDPSPFLLPVFALGAVLFWKVLRLGYRLIVDGDIPEKGTQGLLALSGLMLGLGFAGAIVDFYNLTQLLQGSPGSEREYVVSFLLNGGTLLTLSVLFSLSAAMAWYAAATWQDLIRTVRTDLLGSA